VRSSFIVLRSLVASISYDDADEYGNCTGEKPGAKAPLSEGPFRGAKAPRFHHKSKGPKVRTYLRTLIRRLKGQAPTENQVRKAGSALRK
jgi:hypothetical protein